MSIDIGIDYRATAGFVTDPATCTYCLGGVTDPYPVTRGGATFGWANWDASNDVTFDRSALTGAQAQLAGGNFIFNNSTAPTVPHKFRFDLPATGSYDIRLAIGDQAARVNMTLAVFDSTTSLVTIVSQVASSANQWWDAGSNLRTSASDWVTNNVVKNLTFATTQLILAVGAIGSGAGNYTAISHLQVTTHGGGTAYTQSLSGQMSTFRATGTPRVIGRVRTAAMQAFAAISSRLNARTRTATMPSFAGASTRSTAHAIAATMLSFAGSIKKTAGKALSATMLAMSGSGTKQTGKSEPSSMSAFSATTTKAATKSTSATMAAFAAATSRKISILEAATMNAFNGLLVAVKGASEYFFTVAATMSTFFSSSTRSAAKSESGSTAAMGAATTRAITRSSFAQTAPFTGQTSRRIALVATAVMSAFNGLLNAVKGANTYFLTVAATMSPFQASTRRATDRSSSASTSPFSAALSRAMARSQSATMQPFAGRTSRAFTFIANAVMSAFNAVSVSILVTAHHFFLSFDATMSAFMGAIASRKPSKPSRPTGTANSISPTGSAVKGSPKGTVD